MLFDTIATMRAIITGGAGFIGQHLCSRLLASHAERIFVVDDYSTPAPRQLEDPRIHYINRDVRCLPTLEHDADVLFHLACPAAPEHYQADPVKTIETAFLGTRNVLHWATIMKRPVVLASTSEIYGDPKEHPQREEYWGNVNSWGPRAMYDEGKRAGEALAWSYLSRFETDVKVARIFNTYGPNMRADDGRVVPNFVLQALRGTPLTVYGSGEQTRSFCYVDDLVNGLIALAQYNGPFRVFNLGNPDECTVNDFATLVLELTSSKSTIVQKRLPTDDPVVRRPDISRAVCELKWEPTVTLRDGLKNTIDWFREFGPSA